MTDSRRPAPVGEPIHEILSHRWSPRAFEPRPVEPEKLRSLFEAARWAPSTGNSQPWFFIVAPKNTEPENFRRALECFVEQNQSWAKNASVLAFSVARMNFEQGGKPNRHAFHDVGQAAANLAVEATSLDLEIHQMGGIDPEKVRRTFGVPEDYELSPAWPSAIPAIR